MSPLIEERGCVSLLLNLHSGKGTVWCCFISVFNTSGISVFLLSIFTFHPVVSSEGEVCVMLCI